MKKVLIFFIVTVALLGGAISIITINSLDQEKTKGTSSDSREEVIIAENIEKYHPRKTKRTKDNDLGISAGAAIVVDQETNEIIYEKNIDQKLSPASIVKILTFAIALENFKENDLIEITPRASEQVSNKISMEAGEKIRLSDLLYGLMMISANDAAYAIADAHKEGFEGFMKEVNEKSRLLGLENTVVKNPAGLDESDQVSTAYDVATITKYALTEHPKMIKYAGKTTEHSVYATESNKPHWWFGHLSRMLTAYPHMIAAKTGFTHDAGNTYVGIAEKEGQRLVMVMMGAKNTSANEDVRKLLDFGFSN